MKRYFNTKTREDVVIMVGVSDILRDISGRWNQSMKNPPKKVTKFLRSAASFVDCAVRELDKDLDAVESDRIYRTAQTTKFQLNYVKYDLSAKAPGAITYDITEDERDNIVEALAEVRCKGCKGKLKECKVRDQFFKWDVTPIHEITDKKHPCQYMEV